MRAYGYQDIFNKVLPHYGLTRLCVEDSELWSKFVEAKKYRGMAVHQSRNLPFDKTEMDAVREHLHSFFGVARWLSLQLHRPWELDFPGAAGLLDPFP